jgi:hypothetical protein
MHPELDRKSRKTRDVRRRRWENNIKIGDKQINCGGVDWI